MFLQLKNQWILIKLIVVFFPSLNQRFDKIICVYWFELFSRVSDVAHGPLVIQYFLIEMVRKYSLILNVINWILILRILSCLIAFNFATYFSFVHLFVLIRSHYDISAPSFTILKPCLRKHRLHNFNGRFLVNHQFILKLLALCKWIRNMSPIWLHSYIIIPQP